MEIIAPKKFDRRRKYYMVLDCETATLPIINPQWPAATKRKIAIAKPLIYNLGWVIADRKGRIYEQREFLITEIFSVPDIFNTAYYKEKRPLYLEKLRRGEISLTDWITAADALQESLEHIDFCGAYNAMFDFKKAIPFTSVYIDQLYSDNYYNWLERQKKSVAALLRNQAPFNPSTFDPKVFHFRDKDYPLFDLWGLACEHLLNNDDFKEMCLREKWSTASGKYFSTTAETAFRYLSGNHVFDEEHTALEDCLIELQILTAILAQKASNFSTGIEYFPFKILGKVENYVNQHQNY